MINEKDNYCIYSDRVYCIDGECSKCEHNPLKVKIHSSGKNITIQLTINDILGGKLNDKKE